MRGWEALAGDVAACGPVDASVNYPKLQSKYQDTIGLLVVPVTGYALGLTLGAEDGQPVESVQPGLVALARAVMAKLP